MLKLLYIWSFIDNYMKDVVGFHFLWFYNVVIDVTVSVTAVLYKNKEYKHTLNTPRYTGRYTPRYTGRYTPRYTGRYTGVLYKNRE